MAENIITPQGRGAYVGIFRATAQKNLDGTTGKPKFSIRMVFPPTADLSQMKTEAQAAATAKWGTNIPKTLRSPFRLNGDIDKPVVGVPDDWTVMTFAAAEDRRPGIVDSKRQDIIDDSECYSGAWYRCQVRAYAYETAGNKGVSFGLQNVQKLRDDEPIGGGNMPASKVFDAVEDTGEKKTAAGMFA